MKREYKILSVADEPTFGAEEEARIYAQELADLDQESVWYETEAGEAQCEPRYVEPARTIEICTNSEWLTVFGPLGGMGLESNDESEAASAWYDETCRRIEALGYETERAKGQRILCHGWNGANTFQRKSSGLGTFSQLTDAEWETATDIACAVADEVVKRYAEIEEV